MILPTFWDALPVMGAWTVLYTVPTIWGPDRRTALVWAK